jgi:DNA-binding transcriptional MocR family regulator
MTEREKLSLLELARLRDDLKARYDAFRARGLKLDMTRGKPSAAQLDLTGGLVEVLRADDYKASDGTDVRNYGGLDGLPEMKAIFADLFEVPPAQVVVGNNSSLALMHDFVVQAMLHGVPDGVAPWAGQQPKFLCPSPGYDRHFSICQHLGIEMLTVDMREDGPDVEAVARLVAADPTVKGLWCVPKYSNPTGFTCSSAVVERLASMPAAAPDFRLLWDNAYAVHDLYATTDPLANLLAAAEQAGHQNRPVVFASTSKISFAGAGVAALASSPANVADIKRHLFFQTIGPDKLNQLRHVRFFRNLDGIHAHMQKHAALLRPKFEAVAGIFQRELGGLGVATWTRPRGGYFVSLDTPDGCATQVVRLADQAGVKLTAAGATFPYGRDPRDRNIRIAPSLPPLEQIEVAMEVVAVSVALTSVNRLLG